MSAYRNDVDALASRHTALEGELASKTREVAQAAQLLAEAQAQAKRAVLDNIRVATPCAMKWEDMSGDERVRACAACSKNVYNLSGLTRDEAEALVIEKEGKLCVRYFQRKDGTILLRDCSIGIRLKRRRYAIAAGAVLLLGGAALFAFKSSHGILAVDIAGSTDESPVAGGMPVPLPMPDDVHAVAGGMSAPIEVPHEVRGEPPMTKQVNVAKPTHANVQTKARK